MSTKTDLINDIQNLLNSYEDVAKTSINPSLLEFLDEKALRSIIDKLLSEKEHLSENNRDWLEQFKCDKSL
ncbi:MAG: hypothetical protein IE880_06360 [Epsilonproteobacteria bacterium]|nr:hypothetical protein [Campylobacterota bacterium]